ncbi:MAG TPA: hypothetical protein VF950_23330 [Planctomycetota bacterium]
MGHEILYCVGCQTQLRGSDFEKRQAFRVDGKGYCSRCANNTFSAERLAALKEASSPSSTKLRETPAKPTRRVATPELSSSSRYLGIGGLVVLAAVAVLIALLSGGSAKPAPVPAPTPPPVVVKKEVAPPLPNPAGLDAELQRLLPRREFGQALRLIESARALSAQPEWNRMVNQRSDDVHARAEAALKEMKAKAVAAKRAGNLEEPRKIREELVKWEYARALSDFDAALDVVQPERTGKILVAENFSAGLGRFTGGEAVDGALAIPPGGGQITSPFGAVVSPTAVVRFQVKPPAAAFTQLELMIWSQTLGANCWVHLSDLKKGEWQTVEIKASEFKVGWARNGASVVGQDNGHFKIYWDTKVTSGRVLIDDFEVRE